MSLRAQIIIVVLLGVSIALAATNPTKTEYGDFLRVQLHEAMRQIDRGDSPEGRAMVRQFLAAEGPHVIDELVARNTVRRNYGLCSLFETQALNIRVVMLGVAGKFFPLEGQDALANLIGRQTF